MGAYAAACTAGIFSLEDGLKLIAARGRLMGGLPTGGSMAAVFAGADLVAARIQALPADLAIATLNAPDNTVVSGSAAEVQRFVSSLQKEGIQARPLKVSHAFHSPLIDPILPALEQAAAEITFSSPKIPFVSDSTGAMAPGSAAAQAAYWRDHTRNTVHFAEGVETLYQQGARIFLEIGPAPT